jgi:LytTR family transcriptional regulator, CO-responsive transcriptional regulator RcoM
MPIAATPAAPIPQSPLYLLERFEVGVVHLDADRRVTGMNDFARRVLPVDEKQPFSKMVLDFHPERSQPKVSFLLDQAAACPVANPPPMTMIINIPERVLLIKVSRTSDAQLAPTGYVLVFYDITDVVAADEAGTRTARPDTRRQLRKVPTVVNQAVAFVEADDILRLYSDGHYTRVLVASDGSGGPLNQFCNLSIGDLEGRLDPEHFMRVHRSHIVNLREVVQLQRDDGRLLLKLRGDEQTVPVSRSSASSVLDRLGMRGGVPVLRPS